RARFQDEAQALALVQHPNVARFLDLVVGDPTFLVMEFVKGPTLYDVLLREKKLAVDRALRLATHLCWAMDSAHAAGVIHRDLKPSNIILARDRQHGEMPKIIDFGLARLSQGGRGPLTKTGFAVGTPQYMAPEQLRGGPVDARTDIYSLGCVLYEILGG